ncbi:hypothetical protein D3C84_1214910 [compost metagenome]
MLAMIPETIQLYCQLSPASYGALVIINIACYDFLICVVRRLQPDQGPILAKSVRSSYGSGCLEPRQKYLPETRLVGLPS